ncbi:hypothetical protein PPACK8108_LOCUS4967 [Phakopsora pachyrhizi]|uniref:Uncharacterized protein n=1 Tax=Phakopsora pachyrhizi TaxID=170000 RepID=A0AAV0APA3_PHAPC|nr:hypothetical protein PPACK8108_LOCUS4967 [Phakopsora pachyrhizi]
MPQLSQLVTQPQEDIFLVADTVCKRLLYSGLRHPVLLLGVIWRANPDGLKESKTELFNQISGSVNPTHPTNQQENPKTSVLIGRGGAGNMVIKRSISADWATQINQDLTVEEELVTFVETDGVSSEESSPACSTGELVNP